MRLLMVLLLSGCNDQDSASDIKGDTGTLSQQDGDGDGFSAEEGDCNDGDPSISPDGVETCDGVDDDCDGVADDGVTSTFYGDGDQDGFGDTNIIVDGCNAPVGYVGNDNDCDDTNALIYPNAPEICDALDNDCDGQIDEDATSTWYADTDGDGFGDPNDAYDGCQGTTGYTTDGTDCDDTSDAVYPGNTERCDGLDNNCDDVVDNDPTDATVYYDDDDGDGYGDDGQLTTACDQPAGYAEQGGDCDDADPAYNPGASEDDCTDPNDYNCDGSVGYADADGDGFAACEECNDADAAVFPGAAERCNGADDDCDGTTDEDATDAPTWYADADADGFGDPDTTTNACDQPATYLSDATDCDDADAAVFPGATEVCNTRDDDCDGLTDEFATDAITVYADDDGDGFGNDATAYAACDGPTTVGGDCDDGEPTIFPGATELCNGLDDDCDGATDEDATDPTTYYADIDSDGYGDFGSITFGCEAPAGYTSDATDCDDTDAATYPGAPEDCTDPEDRDCDGLPGAIDADGDGASACEDCDDAAPAVYPGAPETCDGTDEDCDGSIDEDAAAANWYIDADMDGYGDDLTAVTACSGPAGYIPVGGDCDDTNDAFFPGAPESCDDPNDYDCDGVVSYADVDGDGVPACEDCDDTNSAAFPGATETCDGTDEDCDGAIDEDVPVSTYLLDADGDGYGDDAIAVTACAAPAGYVAVGGDCDDSDPAFYPGATEVCTDPTDYNCDGSTGYRDDDADGVAACEDCDDTNAAAFPGAAEVCNAIDDNCDGSVDEGYAYVTSYTDADGDGFGDSATETSSCEAPIGSASVGGDCDDSDSAFFPGAPEYCDDPTDYDCDGAVSYADVDGDGVAACEDCDDADATSFPGAAETCDDRDNDCDGSIDDGLAVTAWYADTDGDGFGDDSVTISDCAAPTGYVADGGDCLDSDSSIYPGADEYCNAFDDDCDGSIDEDTIDSFSFYIDADGDGYGDTEQRACEQPTGTVVDGGDCDDADASINPDAEETCNDADDDCDGLIDDGVSDLPVWYQDYDNDGYGNAAATVSLCDAPAGYVSDNTDCNDVANAVHPDANEFCNEVDDDCDGTIDEASAEDATVWFYDADGDGYGSSSSYVSCDIPAGYVDQDGDCDDADYAVYPGAIDTCDAVDNDCDGAYDEAGYCPCSVYTNSGTPYMFCNYTAAWSSAEATCSYYGYDLVTINDSTENTWVVNTAYTLFYGKWWTGYNDVATESRWVWSSGEAATYSNWYPGEPNNAGNEDCMQLGRFLDYRWNDEPCGSPFRFICEG